MWTEYTEFLEAGCDAALFVGMHARAGTGDGVMNHTISGRDFQNLRFNGTLVGETGINANAAHALRFRTGVELIDARTVVSRAETWWEAWKQFYF